MKQVAAAIAALSKQQVRAYVCNSDILLMHDNRIFYSLLVCQIIEIILREWSFTWHDSTEDMILPYYIIVYHNEIRWDNGITTYYLIFYFDVYFDICAGILYSITHEIRLYWIALHKIGLDYFILC